MASISLPVYDWDPQDAYHSFFIFCHTLQNWLLLNCILPDRGDHLRYVFAALGTKSLEMHAIWMSTGSEEEQKVTKVKASAFLDQIQQGMTHNINTHVHLGELKDIVARLGEDPQDLVTHIKTLIDHCEMINDEHHKHKLHHHIICAYCHWGHWGPKCCGGKPLQPRNAPPPGSQQRKSRCPPRNHNNCQGWSNKTDTIDVDEDHSPIDEIALHYIQPNPTVRHTHLEEIMVGDVHAPQCNETYTTIQLPASASRKETASLHVKVDTGAGGNVLPLCVF